MTIHPTAIIDPAATLADDVQIGPYCIIGPHVKIGAGTVLKSHVVISGYTTIGKNNTIYPFACLGEQPQDKKYEGEASRLVIGNDNDIREYVTMNPGTAADREETTVGDNNLFMVHAHVAHDCVVGSGCILANNATLAGHVVVEDFAIIGGLAAVQQFARIGAHAIVGGHSGVDRDVIPYGSAWGNRVCLEGVNIVGLRRREFARETIMRLQQLFDDLFDSSDDSTLAERVDRLESSYQDLPEAVHIMDFIRNSSRGLCTPGSGYKSAA